MKIGFDVSQTGTNKAGCGYFAYLLIKQLTQIDRDNAYILYSNFGPDFWDPDHKSSTFQTRQPNFERRFANFSHARARDYWINPPLDFEDQLGSPDIVHANNFFCPKELRHACLVYTLYDLSIFECPEFTTNANWLICFNGTFEASLRADAIVSISEYSRRHFLDVYPHYPPERIKVLSPASRFSLDDADAADEEAGKLEGLPPGQFWLSVGTIEPRKNVRRLLQAYALLRHERLTDMPLAVAGGGGWLEEGLRDYIATLGIQQDVHMLGYVSDMQLRWLYRHCFAFLYPSLFEGFGIPVLEAMTLGVPVITSNVTSLPEITGDAAIAINPNDVEAIAEAMKRLQSDSALYADLQRRALIRSSLFSWEKTARGVLNLYEMLLQRSYS